MERIRAYKIEGDIFEMENMVCSNTRIIVSLKDVLSVLVKDKTNYIKVGYGENLTDAYKDASVERRVCRLVYIYYSNWSYGDISELNEFIHSIGKDIIFGYSINEKLRHPVKIVILCQ